MKDRKKIAILFGGCSSEHEVSLQPIFVKPASEGSSIDMNKIFHKEELLPAVDFAFQYGQKVILEESIEGFEVGCAVLGSRELALGAVDEIEVPGGFFDFKKSIRKRILISTCRPEYRRKRQRARDVYLALGCKGLARVGGGSIGAITMSKESV